MARTVYTQIHRMKHSIFFFLFFSFWFCCVACCSKKIMIIVVEIILLIHSNREKERTWAQWNLRHKQRHSIFCFSGPSVSKRESLFSLKSFCCLSCHFSKNVFESTKRTNERVKKKQRHKKKLSTKEPNEKTKLLHLDTVRSFRLSDFS